MYVKFRSDQSKIEDLFKEHRHTLTQNDFYMYGYLILCTKHYLIRLLDSEIRINFISKLKFMDFKCRINIGKFKIYPWKIIFKEQNQIL